MANLQQRGGQVLIRVGGNTQETAVLVPSTPDGLIIEKDLAGVTNPVRPISPPSYQKENLTPYNIDRYSPSRIHPRSHIHARQRLLSRKRQMVPRHPLQRHTKPPSRHRRTRRTNPRRLPHRSPSRKRTRFIRHPRSSSSNLQSFRLFWRVWDYGGCGWE